MAAPKVRRRHLWQAKSANLTWAHFGGVSYQLPRTAGQVNTPFPLELETITHPG